MADRERLTRLLSKAGTIDGIGRCDALVVSGPFYVSHQTRLYLGTQPETGKRVLIKFAVNPDTDSPDVDFARRQFEVMTKAAAGRIDGRPLLVPRPLHLFEDEAVIVQAWIEGRGLDEVIADRRIGLARLEALMRAAGMWLGEYHAVAGIAFRPMSLDHLAAEVAPLERVARRLEAALPRLAGSAQPVVRLHCDFKPSNVIVGDVGVAGIDFHESSQAPVWFDVAHFLNATMLDLLKARRFGLLRHSEKLEAAFLAGYTGAARVSDASALPFFLVYDLARYTLQHSPGGRRNPRQVLKSWVTGRVLARRLRALAASR